MLTLEIIFWVIASVWIICFISSIITFFVEDLRDRYIYIYFMFAHTICCITLLVINLFL